VADVQCVAVALVADETRWFLRVPGTDFHRGSTGLHWSDCRIQDSCDGGSGLDFPVFDPGPESPGVECGRYPAAPDGVLGHAPAAGCDVVGRCETPARTTCAFDAIPFCGQRRIGAANRDDVLVYSLDEIG